MALPDESQARKDHPIATGVLDYFPDALAAIARVSKIGNEQHNPGSPLHWDRSKSTDEADALMRHFIERGKMDADGLRHSAKMAWRALALLQKELENEVAMDRQLRSVCLPQAGAAASQFGLVEQAQPGVFAQPVGYLAGVPTGRRG
jgi:hypothetical protein